MANKIRPGRKHSFRVATVILYFQRFPGTDSSYGITATVPYILKIDGKVVKSGNTEASGRLVLNFNPNKKAVLEILGSIYNISVRNKLEKVNTLHGIQKRLNMLGYNAGRVDGAIGPRTERAVLNFQADNDPLRIDGIPGPETQKTLKKVVGE